MDLELKDPRILKCNTLQVLINYPNGIRFGDFIGAFYEIHHFHPQFSHYGYSSLRELLDDMRKTVVVKGSKSGKPVMKLADDFNFDGWLHENEENGLDSFEEEHPRLKEKEGRQEETAAADLATVLAAITNLLMEYESGLKIKKIQALLLSTDGIDLETFSISKGYKNVLMFLDDQIPYIKIRWQGIPHKCVAQLPKDLTVASVPICSILQSYPDGLQLTDLKEAVKKKCGYDLEVFCYQVGYDDIVSCLQQIPQLIIIQNKNRNCHVRLRSASIPASFSSASQSSHSPSFALEQSICTSNNSNQDESENKPAVLSNVMESLTALLNRYTAGLRVKKLQDFLLAEEGIDLEKISIALGYKDTVEFLEQKMPQLVLNYKMNRLNTVVAEPHSDVPIPLLKSTGTAHPLNSAPASFRCSSSQSSSSSSSSSDQSTCTSKNSNQFKSEKKPDLKDIFKPAFTISDLSASDSQRQNVPAAIALVPPEVNNLFRTKPPSPATMTSNFPSFQEPHNASSVKVKSSSHFPSIVLSQQPCQLSANSHTEDLPSNSNVTTFQTSTVQDKLKQQVAQLLAMYPEGMSLFQFRIAYSATFKQHFPVGTAASTKQRLLEMPDTVYLKGHGVQALLFPVSSDVSPAKPGQPASSKVENVTVVPSHALVHPVTLTKPAAKNFESCLEPAVPKVAMMPVPKPHHSLQYYQSIRAPEDKGNKPLTEHHPQSVPGFIKIVQTNTSHLNGPSPNLRDVSFIPHFSAALPTCSQDTVCGDNLQPDILKSRFASPTNSKISGTLPSVDLTPVPPVSVKPEIYSPRSTSQSTVGIRHTLPVQPPSPILSTEQRNSNAISEFDSSSEVQKQSRTLQHFSSPDSSAKRNSVSPLFRNSASFFPPRSQPEHQLQQPIHARLDGLQPSSVSLEDKSLIKTSLDRVPPVAMYQTKTTNVNPLETSSTTESFSTCSVSGPVQPLHTSSVIANNSMALSSTSSSGTRAVSPASSLIDSIASASAKITSNSTPLFPETPASTQQRQYASAAATVISNTKTTSPTSLSSESTTSSHYQFAYASSRMTTSSSALSSETYAFTHQRQNAQADGTIIASSTKTVSSISPLDSATSLSCQHVYASAKASSTSVLSPEACAFSYRKQQSATAAADSSGTRSRSKTPSPSKSTVYRTSDAASRTSLNHGPPSQDNFTSSFSKQGYPYVSLQEKQMPESTVTSAVSRIYDGCLIL
ncbi:uncharacterized protein M6D78_017618 isoform 5-T5 [Vipera latastei]